MTKGDHNNINNKWRRFVTRPTKLISLLTATVSVGSSQGCQVGLFKAKYDKFCLF